MPLCVIKRLSTIPVMQSFRHRYKHGEPRTHRRHTTHRSLTRMMAANASKVSRPCAASRGVASFKPAALHVSTGRHLVLHCIHRSEVASFKPAALRVSTSRHLVPHCIHRSGVASCKPAALRAITIPGLPMTMEGSVQYGMNMMMQQDAMHAKTGQAS